MTQQSNENLGEWIKSENCYSNDFNTFFSKILEEANRFQLNVEEIGMVQNRPIVLVSPKNSSLPVTSVLIAAGFHGDEPAGSWGLLKFIENLKEYPTNINLSFLPLVNPTGFESITRTNYLSQDPNRGFYHTKAGAPTPSIEGLILLKQLPKILTLAHDIFVSLHEDWEFEKFYIYTFENSDMPRSFSKTLQQAEQKFFEPFPDGPLEGGEVKNGIIFKQCDGSFEDMLFHEGVPLTACTETPGKLPLETRIDANSFLVEEVVRYAHSFHKDHKF